MFTGLIETVGRIALIEPTPTGARLRVEAPAWDKAPSPGESIAVSGVCLTVVDFDAGDRMMQFDIIAATLGATTLGQRTPGDRVNLEQAARADTALGGHIVQGHVDGVGQVQSVTDIADDRRLRIAMPGALLDCAPQRGSIAIEGVSLTIARALEDTIEVALIPTTLRETTLGELRAGSTCNIETDIVAKTVVHWLSRHQGADGAMKSTSK